MNSLLAILILGLCVAAMAVGLILAKKVLRKGCCADPAESKTGCACRGEHKDHAEDSEHPKTP